MNYRYRAIDMDCIVSEAEHQAIQAAIGQGQTIMRLRNNTIGINTATASWKPTYELTVPQQDARDRQLLLGRPDPQNPVRLTKEERRRTFCSFRTKRGWEHPDWCCCKEEAGANMKKA